MPLIHLKHPQRGNYLFACFRRVNKSYGYNEQSFIELYNKFHGKDCCSKCSAILINQGKLAAAENTITESFKQLVEKLINHSKNIHDQYIVRVRAFADSSFTFKEKKNNRPQSEWDREYNVIRDGMYRYDRDYYKMRDAQDRLKKVVEKGRTAFIEGEVKDAESHYSNAIHKLAFAIEERSLNVSKMAISYGKVTDNGIDTVITDGVNTIHAWTILAALDSTCMKPQARLLSS